MDIFCSSGDASNGNDAQWVEWDTRPFQEQCNKAIDAKRERNAKEESEVSEKSLATRSLRRHGGLDGPPVHQHRQFGDRSLEPASAQASRRQPKPSSWAEGTGPNVHTLRWQPMTSLVLSDSPVDHVCYGFARSEDSPPQSQRNVRTVVHWADLPVAISLPTLHAEPSTHLGAEVPQVW